MAGSISTRLYSRTATSSIDLETLSDRARGITKEEQEAHPPQLTASDLSGGLFSDHGVADFSKLSFQVPGAEIRLKGNYNLGSQKIDMKGVFPHAGHAGGHAKRHKTLSSDAIGSRCLRKMAPDFRCLSLSRERARNLKSVSKPCITGSG